MIRRPTKRRAMNNRIRTFSDFQITVFGPAYLDCVVRINRPLISKKNRIIDLGGNAIRAMAQHDGEIQIVDESGGIIRITLPDEMASVAGCYHVKGILNSNESEVITMSEVDMDLGGMGAGYAKALGGHLVSCIGASDDETSLKIQSLVKSHRIQHTPVKVDSVAADWTLLITSGEHGDKLPLGLRGCHDSVTAEELIASVPNHNQDLLIIASLKNSLMDTLAGLLKAPIKVLAPAVRNCRETMVPIGNLAGKFDLLTLNQQEWDAMSPACRQKWLNSQATISITNGPIGAKISWIDRDGDRSEIVTDIFPRRSPPADTNRAGEAFASGLIRSFKEQGWGLTGFQFTSAFIREAAVQASAWAGLTVNMKAFGFPDESLVRETIREGSI